jgi:hypothetical protein
MIPYTTMIAEGGISGESGLIFVAKQLGQRDAAEDGGGRGARARDGSKSCRSEHGRDAEPARHPAEPGARAAVGALYDSGMVRQMPDQDEQWQHRECIIRRVGIRNVPGDANCLREAKQCP